MACADLIGRRFGILTVVEDSGQRKGSSVLWRCRCGCGGEILAVRRQLVSGNVTSCGCVPKLSAPRRQAEDLTGRRFGRLTALYHVNREDRARGSYWHCRCDCGNELDVYTWSLLRGLTQSCGCWNRAQSGRMHEHMHYQDDTCLEVLRNSCVDTGRNKAGFRGLFLLNNGKYRASITFRGKHYDLGHYTSFDRAVQARLDAEESLHRGYIQALEAYEEREKADPAWAQDHPFFYDVQRIDGKFFVCTNGTAADLPQSRGYRGVPADGKELEANV